MRKNSVALAVAIMKTVVVYFNVHAVQSIIWKIMDALSVLKNGMIELSTGTLYKLYELYMDCIWTVLKLYMDCTWTILDYFCTVHVQVKIYAQWKKNWLLFFKKNPLTHQFLEISLNFLFCCSFSKIARHILNFHCCLYSSTFWILCIMYKLYCAICESTVNLFVTYIIYF